METMFIELAEQTEDEKLKLQLLDDLVMAEYLYYGLKEDLRYLNAITMYIRRFAESFCDLLFEKEKLETSNPDNPNGGTFSLNLKITKLHEKQHISVEIKDHLHKMREHGNDGVHNYVSTRGSSCEEFKIKKIDRNDILESFKNAFIIYKFYQDKYLGIINKQRYRYDEVKAEASYPYNKDLKKEIEKEFKKEIKAIELEKKKLEEIHNEELEEIGREIIIIEEEYEESVKNKQKEIEELRRKHEEEIEILKRIYEEGSLKYKKEKLILDAKLKKNIIKTNTEYDRKLKELDKKIKQKTKMIKGLLAALGVSVIVFLRSLRDRDKRKNKDKENNKA